MANFLIRLKAKELSVPLWQLADQLHISEASLYRKLRRELPYDKQKEMLDILMDLAQKKSMTYKKKG